MKTTNNTVLITGGSAGIGFAIAKLFSEKNNHVIITGRNEERLKQAAAQLKNVTTIQSDISSEAEISSLVQRLKKDFPKLNLVINNAGNAYAYQLSAEASAYNKAKEEIMTNYLSVIQLNEQLLPLLAQQEEAAIVTVSSIAAFAPNQYIPTYSASKAALHSYTQILRYTLAQSTAIKVFELMPPLVNTDFSKEIGGEHGIPPAEVATDLLNSLEQDQYEIHVGGTAALFQLYKSSPDDALLSMNGALTH